MPTYFTALWEPIPYGLYSPTACIPLRLAFPYGLYYPTAYIPLRLAFLYSFYSLIETISYIFYIGKIFAG